MNFKEDDLLKLSRILEGMVKNPSREDKNYLIDNGVASYQHLWTAVNFLTADGLLIHVNNKVGASFYFIVPKSFAEKLLLLASFENKKESKYGEYDYFKSNYINKTWTTNNDTNINIKDNEKWWNKE